MPFFENGWVVILGGLYKYIKAVFLNGKPFKKNFITQEDINAGGVLKIVASAVAVKISNTENWISNLEK
ncbi:hypothetical protein [Pedobacter borealis]|uniref:hypothetical protein n=1 Tax=Pedobacter borealis TaxID=475254 RepID=UPI000492F087|nr:hypothetical protein [Pedobacter borealis]